MSGYDCIVAGCGGVGSAALYHLAQKGFRVLGFDQYPVGHDRGSSHGETRVIRQAYFEHPDYVPLLQRAYSLWQELQSLRGTQLLYQTGILQIGPPQGEVISGVLRAASEHGLQIQQLAASDVAERFPGFHVPDGSGAVFESLGGYLRVEDCVRAHVELAQARGAEIQTGETIIDWSPSPGGITVTTDKSVYQADSLILATGAWASQWLSQSGLHFKVLRKHLHWFANSDPRYQQDQGAPVFFYQLGERFYYGFPQHNALGVKVSEHSGGELIQNPADLSRHRDPIDFATLADFVQHCLPGVTQTATRHEVCMYTMSPDGHFVLDAHPQHGNVFFAAGLSGHGFKFASVLGEILADLVSGSAHQPPSLFSASRFG